MSTTVLIVSMLGYGGATVLFIGAGIESYRAERIWRRVEREERRVDAILRAKGLR